MGHSDDDDDDDDACHQLLDHTTTRPIHRSTGRVRIVYTCTTVTSFAIIIIETLQRNLSVIFRITRDSPTKTV